MNQKNLARLSEIESRTGLQFSKYQSPEFIEITSGYLTFPRLVIGTAVRGAAFCLTALIAATVALYFATNGSWAWVIFAVLGLLITVPWIFFRTLVRLMRNVESDLINLGELGIGTTRIVVSDVKELAARTTPMVLPSASDLFQGVMLGSLIPTVQAVAETKIPLFSDRISSMVSGLLSRISDAVAGTIDSVQETAVKAVQSTRISVGKRNQPEETPPVEGSMSVEAINRWSESIDSGLQTVGGRFEGIVEKIVGPIQRFGRGCEGLAVVVLSGCWSLIWFFAGS
jgi:hypothetical protein